jgi:hypothetical protein
MKPQLALALIQVSLVLASCGGTDSSTAGNAGSGSSDASDVAAPLPDGSADSDGSSSRAADGAPEAQDAPTAEASSDSGACTPKPPPDDGSIISCNPVGFTDECGWVGGRWTGIKWCDPKTPPGDYCAILGGNVGACTGLTDDACTHFCEF